MEVNGLRSALESFAHGDIDLDQLEGALTAVVHFRFADTNERSVEIVRPLPQVSFQTQDVRGVLERFSAGELTPREVSDWAATMRLLDCFHVAGDSDESDTTWEVIDELMSPDVWGDLTIEHAFELLQRLRG